MNSFLDWPFFEPHHLKLAQDLDAWAVKNLTSLAKENHSDVDAFCGQILKKLSAGGWLKYTVPAEFGGVFEKFDVRSLCIIRETLARHLGLADFVFAMQGLGSGAISLFGSEEIKKALSGDWRAEHLFELTQNYALHKFTWEKLRETDKQVEAMLKDWQEKNGDRSKWEEYSKKKHKPRQKNDPEFDLKAYAYQMTGGVDSSQIEGVNINTILTMMSETGFDIVGKFKTAKHFVSWLGFAPNLKITGGKTMSSNTPKVKKPLTYAIRQAANGAGNSKGRLGDFFRRIAYRKGRLVAIIATARKIGVIIYKMLESGREYSYEYGIVDAERIRKVRINRLIKNIKRFDIRQVDLDPAF